MSNQIEALASALCLASRLHPNQRVAQLIFNALDAKGWARHADSTPRDLYHYSDGDLLEALQHYSLSRPPA